MKSSERYELKLPKKVFPIHSPKKLAGLLSIPLKDLQELSERVGISYNPFSKKVGGKERIFDNPIGFLKEVQRRIHKYILRDIIFPDFVIGGIKNKDPLKHPSSHIKKTVIVTMDVKDCYPSVTNKHIYAVWYEQLKCSPPVSHLATKLTTINGHLPLGASTSTYLANLALLPCATISAQIAKKLGFTFTQHIDDFAFSGASSPEKLITSVIKEFSKNGFRMNRSKLEIMRSGSSQRVTKKIVNKKVSIPMSERSKVRSALHRLKNAEVTSLGYSASYRSVKGKIAHLKKFHLKCGSKMQKVLEHLKKPRKTTQIK